MVIKSTCDIESPNGLFHRSNTEKSRNAQVVIFHTQFLCWHAVNAKMHVKQLEKVIVIIIEVPLRIDHVDNFQDTESVLAIIFLSSLNEVTIISIYTTAHERWINYCKH